MELSSISVLIAVLAGLSGALVTLYVSTKQHAARQIELQLKTQELIENNSFVTQSFQVKLLNHRVNAYKALWKVCFEFEQLWKFKNKDFTLEWANEFIRQLHECNAEHGIFFSEFVFVAFSRLRTLLEDVAKEFPTSQEGINKLNISLHLVLHSSGSSALPNGLYGVLKNDLGSYQHLALRCDAK